MSRTLDDLADILIQRRIITAEQAEEARKLQQQTGATLRDALVKLGYASPEDVMRVIADLHGLAFVDLTNVQVPSSVIEMVPESVARENVCLPLAQGRG